MNEFVFLILFFPANTHSISILSLHNYIVLSRAISVLHLHRTHMSISSDSYCNKTSGHLHGWMTRLICSRTQTSLLSDSFHLTLRLCQNPSANEGQTREALNVICSCGTRIAVAMCVLKRTDSDRFCELELLRIWAFWMITNNSYKHIWYNWDFKAV